MVLLLCAALGAFGENRFPKPQIGGGYTMPSAIDPAARAPGLEALDVVVLVVALSLATWLVLKQRSRRGVFLLGLFSLLYFGFWRRGCICSVGSIQNITLWAFDSGYVLPLSAAAFFILPLIFSLLFGRVFCAAVCPLGAIQDVAVLFPVRIPGWLSRVLGLGPYLYLGLGVLLAGAGVSYIICRYDPFVSLFRFGGDLSMVMTGLLLLLAGVFVARPYCRFLCPFGVLLNWTSRLSRWHVTITPDECVTCRLCENACPFGAIRPANTGRIPEPRKVGVRRLTFLLWLLPALILVGGWAGSLVDRSLARIHSPVRLEEALVSGDKEALRAMKFEKESFESSGTALEDLQAQVARTRGRLHAGGWLFGGFMGAVLGGSLIAASLQRKRRGYEPDRGACLSCGRCYLSCPKEHLRIRKRAGKQGDGER
jgi:ferredoxin